MPKLHPGEHLNQSERGHTTLCRKEGCLREDPAYSNLASIVTSAHAALAMDLRRGPCRRKDVYWISPISRLDQACVLAALADAAAASSKPANMRMGSPSEANLPARQEGTPFEAKKNRTHATNSAQYRDIRVAGDSFLTVVSQPEATFSRHFPKALAAI